MEKGNPIEYEVFGSNAERLSLKEWIIVTIILLGVLYLLPLFWTTIEKFEPTKDFRIPYTLSDDYWVFTRSSKYASSKFPAMVIGDSFVWGQYVSIDKTLSHNLNELEGDNLFANMGLDGLHPAAMDGLLKYYGKDIKNKTILLHLNLLWISSKDHDLQSKEEIRVNHPRLIPQFYPHVGCYKAKFPDKISVLTERYFYFFSWIKHIKNIYFENMDIPNWTMQNPYKIPFISNITSPAIPEPDNGPKSKPVTWIQQKIKIQDFPWVEPEESFQWISFKNVIKTLNDRNNRIFVIIGPFNPYILTENSLEHYNSIKSKIEKWFEENKINYYSPPFLPSELYADASHPLDEGYTVIAKELYEIESFKDWMKSINGKL